MKKTIVYNGETVFIDDETLTPEEMETLQDDYDPDAGEE